MNKYAAEMVGTFVLVFGGIGTAFLAGDHVGWLGVGLAFGLSLLAMAYTIGPISGCHINPAVTIGLLINKKIDAKEGDIPVETGDKYPTQDGFLWTNGVYMWALTHVLGVKLLPIHP